MGLDNPIHLAMLLMILLLVFGARRLPEMGRSLGHGLRGFKEAVSGDAPVAHMVAAHDPQLDGTAASAPVAQPVAVAVGAEQRD